MYHETGRVIIDALKVCYTVDMEVLADLRRIPIGRSKFYGDCGYSFYRVTSHHYHYAYEISIGEGNEREKVATAGFGLYGDTLERNYFFLRVENHVLYDEKKLNLVLALPKQMNMEFHNFTAIDMAIDSSHNFVSIIRKLWGREDVTTIINGKAKRDRKSILDNVEIHYSVSLERLKIPSLAIKQEKARHDKTKGLTVLAYNKGAEIEQASHKDYIKKFYGYPKRLHRLEVHQNNAEIQDYCRKINRAQDIGMIYDQEFLTAMFYYHLSAVLRFTKGRKRLAWPDIIACNGRIDNNTPSHCAPKRPNQKIVNRNILKNLVAISSSV